MRICICAAVTGLAALNFASGIFAAPAETVLYSFTGGADGANPWAGLIFDDGGALYGTTNGGGVNGNGTVFRLMPPGPGGNIWTQSVLYHFNGTDGANPRSDLIFDQRGALYGATRLGGIGGGSGNGVVFKLTPSAQGQTWTQTVLYAFAGGSDGGLPWGGMLLDDHGALYGTTEGGGISGKGTVFKLTPPEPGQTVWKHSVLYQFTGGTIYGDTDGAQPLGVKLVMDKDGSLYGTTIYGGYNGNGVVFKLTPPTQGHMTWTESVLYAFTGAGDGAFPQAGLLFDKSGVLYGTTNGGGISGNGVVFKLMPPGPGRTDWTQSVLYSFTGSGDGGNPDAALIQDRSGVLYSTTNGGGIGGINGNGVVFKLTPPAPGQAVWTESVLYSFAGGSDGRSSVARLIADKNGELFGTTLNGGINDSGVVFKLATP
jgi:uncharacterized repeat protein (TIGR03803 family)